MTGAKQSGEREGEREREREREEGGGEGVRTEKKKGEEKIFAVTQFSLTTFRTVFRHARHSPLIGRTTKPERLR